MTEALVVPGTTDTPAAHWVAVDLGGTQIRTAVFTQSGQMLDRRTVPTPSSQGRQHVLAALVREVRRAVDSSSQPVQAVAVSALGPVEPRTGIIRSAPTIVDFSDVPLAATLRDNLDLPVHVINDANAAAVAEWRLGSGRGTANFGFVTVSTGIGCGLIVNGALVEGHHGVAGELGRTRVHDDDGALVRLESVAAGHGMTQRAEAAIAAGSTTVLQRTSLSGRSIAKAAGAGDELAGRLVHQAATALAVQLANLTRTVDPERIAIGGGISKAGQVYWTPLRRAFQESLEEDEVQAPELVPATLEGDVGLHGAALELQRIYAG